MNNRMPSQQQTTRNKSAAIDFCIYKIITTTAILLLLLFLIIITSWEHIGRWVVWPVAIKGQCRSFPSLLLLLSLWWEESIFISLVMIISVFLPPSYSSYSSSHSPLLIFHFHTFIRLVTMMMVMVIVIWRITRRRRIFDYYRWQWLLDTWRAFNLEDPSFLCYLDLGGSWVGWRSGIPELMELNLTQFTQPSLHSPPYYWVAFAWTWN